MNWLLSVQNLSKTFGGLRAVSDFTFDLADGEILGLVGPNGAGKSTAFGLISGFLKPTSGRVSFDGQDVTGFAPRRLVRMGLVRTFQHGSIFSDLSVSDNVRLASTARLDSVRERNRAATEAIELFQLQDLLHMPSRLLPHGLQRIVSMAMAAAAQPRLLCLDEPLTGLGEVECKRALEAILYLRENRKISVLLVEHNLRAVMQICGRVIVLDFGKKIGDSAPLEMKNNPKVLEAYLGSGV